MASHIDNITFKRITANLPSQLLKEAQKSTGQGITETLIKGLELLRKRQAYLKAMSLKGKLKLELNIDASRERTRS